MSVNNFEHRRDSNLESSPETTKVPMTKHPYNPATNANVKTHLSESSNINIPVPPGGRGIAGYGNSRPIGGQGKTGAHNAVSNESGRTSMHTRAVGKVLKTTNHPNSKINGIYG